MLPFVRFGGISHGSVIFRKSDSQTVKLTCCPTSGFGLHFQFRSDFSQDKYIPPIEKSPPPQREICVCCNVFSLIALNSFLPPSLGFTLVHPSWWIRPRLCILNRIRKHASLKNVSVNSSSILFCVFLASPAQQHLAKCGLFGHIFSVSPHIDKRKTFVFLTQNLFIFYTHAYKSHFDFDSSYFGKDVNK